MPQILAICFRQCCDHHAVRRNVYYAVFPDVL